MLNDAQASELARFGVLIETLYEQPMDIEWALAREQFAILQARPITTLQEALLSEPPLEWKSPYPTLLLAHGDSTDLAPAREMPQPQPLL